MVTSLLNLKGVAHNTGTDNLVVLYPNQIIKYVKILQASEAEITFHYSPFPLNI